MMVPSRELQGLEHTVSAPPEEVELCLDQVERIAAKAVAYLRARNVEITELDATTIKDVTNLQIFAKATHARRIGPFVDLSSEDYLLVEAIGRHFRDGLKPMAALVEQVGRFEHGCKAFYPKVARPGTSNVPAGYVGTAYFIGTRRLYIRPIEGHPLEDLARNPELLAGIPVERLYWSEEAKPNTISLTQLSQNYENLLQRVRRKNPHLLTEVDLTSGKGTAAQLVGTRPDALFCQEQLAWSKVILPASVLCLGAGFGFGQGSNDYWHRYEGVVCEITVDLPAFYA